MHTPSHTPTDTIKNIALSVAALLVALNAGDDIIKKIQDHREKNLIEEQRIRTSTIPDMTPPYINRIPPQSAFSQSVRDLIKQKGGLEILSQHISYTKDSQLMTINIGCLADDIVDQKPITLRSLGDTKTEKTSNLLTYRAEDYNNHKDILCRISTEWLNIQSHDDYRSKVQKIQNFVWGLGYERDLIYLGEDGQLPALGDYQLPVLANLIIGTMDCNNKTGLFVQLCWANDILVGAGMSQIHVAPVVYTHASDKIRDIVISNTSFFIRGQEYKGVVVDPTISDLTHKQPRPRIVGDMKGDAYKDMQFVIIKPQ